MKWRTIILIMVLVFLGIAAPVGVITFNQHLTNDTQLSVTCTSAKANIEQLTALQEIADQLGIPHKFTVPEVPPECAGL